MDTPKKKILIVDDDVQFTNTLSEKVVRAGLDAYVTRSGREALDYLVDNTVDFIVLDFIMPEMDGYTFYHIMLHDMRKNIPTIILTNLEGSENKDKNLEVFLKSETDLDVLIAKIKAHLEQANAQTA